MDFNLYTDTTETFLTKLPFFVWEIYVIGVVLSNLIFCWFFVYLGLGWLKTRLEDLR